MKYLYANFTDSAINYGNLIIDFATKRLLKNQLQLKYEEFDCLNGGGLPQGEYDFAIIPGCTLLTAGQSQGLRSLSELNIPIYCLAGNIWAPQKPYGFLLRTRVLRFRQPPEPDLGIVRLCRQPVGCRDPYTYDQITRAGIQAIYMGCPTLLLPNDDTGNDGFVLFSFGRHHLRTQVRYGRQLSHDANVIGICHQKNDYDRIRAAGWRLPLVDYHGDLDMYLSYFKRASVVITGRLHGALPALAYGKRVFYFGTNDSRTTILDDLGVPIHPYRAIPHGVALASSAINGGVVDYYKKSWQGMLDLILEQCRSSPSFQNGRAIEHA